MLVIDFYLNKIRYFSLLGFTFLQLCLLKAIEIPRFCYHEQLTIAGNCRMCLIEENKTIKLLVSCATNLLNKGFKIYTNTKKIKKTRESIIEFLLINHPLDCPICDQGGECDLQDQSLIFGSDRGRFYEFKKNTPDKNLGPFIKTSMNRCIHCTRCIRFAEKLNANPLGITGRGGNSEIGNYVNIILNNEMSGNIIDLCPVGALTQKSFSFTARSWELTSFETIDILNSTTSSIRMDIRGNSILRILPQINSITNENWISNKIRFLADSLKKNRIKKPYLKLKNKIIGKNYCSYYLVISWTRAFFFIKKKILNSFIEKQYINYNIFFFFIIGNFVDLETIILLKKFSNFLGTSSSKLIESEKQIFHNKIKVNIPDFKDNYIFNQNHIYSLINFNLNFLFNINLRVEAPLLNLKLKDLIKLKKINFYYIGSNFNMDFFIKKLGNNTKTLLKIINGVHWLINNFLKKKILFILNESFLNKKINIIKKLKNLFINNLNKKKLFYLSCNTLVETISSTSTNEINLTSNKNFPNLIKIKKFNNFFYLIGNNNPKLLKKIIYSNLKKKFIIYQGHSIKNIKLQNSINLFLPGKNFTEKSSIFLNNFGKIQKTQTIIINKSFAKTDWRIILTLMLYLKIKINIRNKQQIILLSINLSPFFNKLKKKIINFYYKIQLKKKKYNNIILKINSKFNYLKKNNKKAVTLLNFISLLNKKEYIYNFC